MTEVFYQLLDNAVAMEACLPFFTSNVAHLMKFKSKGRLTPGCDADLLILDPKKRIKHVMAQGQWHVLISEL